jgi:DNA replication and repair protein RecF
VGLHELTVRDFRLFHELSFAPDPDATTVLLSPNGTGKTSVLEAVYALATASSFRTNVASDMIRNGESLAEVHGVVLTSDRRIQVDLTLARGARNTTKRMLVNGQRPTSRADLSAALPLTVFTPEGVDVVRGGPEHRRAFLTTLLTDVEPRDAEMMERFARVLTQRNALLRSLEGSRPSSTQQGELDQWSRDFAEISEVVVARREKLLGDLEPLVAEFYRQLAETNNDVAVRYERSWEGELGAALEAASNDDRFRGYTTLGPHRDDIQLLLEGRDARRQASQGEQRSLALALRLAGHELIRQERSVEPLLLLDDVFSELDPVRSSRLLALLPEGQTLVTTASPLPEAMSPAAVIDLTGTH